MEGGFKYKEELGLGNIYNPGFNKVFDFNAVHLL